MSPAPAAVTVPRMADDVSVSKEIAAPPDKVWAMVADVTRMGEWSPENDGGTWLGDATEAKPGAKFAGANHNDKKKCFDRKI